MLRLLWLLPQVNEITSLRSCDKSRRFETPTRELLCSPAVAWGDAMGDDNGSPSLKRKRFSEAEAITAAVKRPSNLGDAGGPHAAPYSDAARPTATIAVLAKTEIVAVYNAYKVLLASEQSSEEQLLAFKRLLEASAGLLVLAKFSSYSVEVQLILLSSAFLIDIRDYTECH